MNSNSKHHTNTYTHIHTNTQTHTHTHTHTHSYGWYLDHLQMSWLDFYNQLVFTSSQWTNKLKSKILGGEISAWGKTDLKQTNMNERINATKYRNKQTNKHKHKQSNINKQT